MSGTVSPDDIDVREVRSHLPDRGVHRIHVYGGNIGRIDRHVFDPSTRARQNLSFRLRQHPLPGIFNHS